LYSVAFDYTDQETGTAASKNLTSALCGISSDVYDPYLGVYSAFTVITGLVVGLRFLSRFVGKATFWWDDWFNLGAVAGSAAYTTVGLVCKSRHLSARLHSQNLTHLPLI
jgi:hypothetical protein